MSVFSIVEDMTSSFRLHVFFLVHEIYGSSGYKEWMNIPFHRDWKNNLKEVWEGMKTITGCKKSRSTTIPQRGTQREQTSLTTSSTVKRPVKQWSEETSARLSRVL